MSDDRRPVLPSHISQIDAGEDVKLLRFNRISMSDQGHYVCWAHNLVGEAKLRAEVIVQVWSLNQFYSVDFSQSRINVKKCVFNIRSFKICVSCLFLTVSWDFHTRRCRLVSL